MTLIQTVSLCQLLFQCHIRLWVSLSVCQLMGFCEIGLHFGYITRAPVDIVTLVCVNTCSLLLSMYSSLHPDTGFLG